MSEAASHKKTIKEVSYLMCVLSLALVIMRTFYTSSTEVRTYVCVVRLENRCCTADGI